MSRSGWFWLVRCTLLTAQYSSSGDAFTSGLENWNHAVAREAEADTATAMVATSSLGILAGAPSRMIEDGIAGVVSGGTKRWDDTVSYATAAEEACKDGINSFHSRTDVKLPAQA